MFFNKKTRTQKVLSKITTSDMALIKLSTIFFGLALATYFPQITQIDPIIYLFLMLIFAIKPMMLWLK